MTTQGENKVFGNEQYKEKHLKKTLDRYVNKDQNQFPKDFLFFQHFENN